MSSLCKFVFSPPFPQKHLIIAYLNLGCLYCTEWATRIWNVWM